MKATSFNINKIIQTLEGHVMVFIPDFPLRDLDKWPGVERHNWPCINWFSCVLFQQEQPPSSCVNCTFISVTLFSKVSLKYDTTRSLLFWFKLNRYKISSSLLLKNLFNIDLYKHPKCARNVEKFANENYCPFHFYRTNLFKS